MQIRQRRLARVEVEGTNVQSNENSSTPMQVDTSGPITENVSGKSVSSLGHGLSSNEQTDFSPIKKASKTEHNINSPHSSNIKISSSSQAQAPTSGVKLDREARALNLTLESCLMFTLRPEAATDGVVYLSQDSSVGELINPSNVSMLIFARLSESSELLNAVNYLAGCYKKLMIKETSASTDKVRDDLMK